jgi:hypothetical protein
MWTAVILGVLGCYLLKLAGLSVPKSLLENERVRQVAGLLPVALLAALIGIQTFSDAQRLTFDPRAAGLGVAMLAILFRAPFLVVVALAAVSTAGLRALL